MMMGSIISTLYARGFRHGIGRRSGGFTLIELILVMLLLAVVMAVSSPSLARFSRGRNLDLEARRFLSLTRQAQSRAVAEGVPMVLKCDLKQRAYGLSADKSYLEEDPRAAQYEVEASVEMDVELSVEAKSAAQASAFKNEKLGTTGTYSLRFNPDGFVSVSSPEAVVFRQKDNGEIRVAQSRNRLNYEIQTGKSIANR